MPGVPPRRACSIFGLALLFGCGELPRYAWELGEAPRALLIRTDVVEDGPVAEGVASVQVGRRRAELLPGDVVELNALVATADGPIDLEESNAAWFFCAEACPLSTLDDEQPCDEAEPFEAKSCFAGRGRPRLVMPGEIRPIPIPPRLWSQVVVVSGRSADETETCLSKLRDGLRESVQGCAIAARAPVYGPEWRMLEESIEQSLPEGLEPQPGSVPLGLARLVTPNSAAEIQRVRVRLGDAEERTIHDLDEPIVVPVGATLTIEAEPEPIDRQFVIVPVTGVPDAFTAVFDTYFLEVVTDDEGDATLQQPDIASGFAAPVLSLGMPFEPGTIGAWLLVSDLRGGRSWTRVRFEVVET